MLLDPTVANLNTGSFGPLPRVVFARATALRQRLAEEPMDFLVRQAPPLLWDTTISDILPTTVDDDRLVAQPDPQMCPATVEDAACSVRRSARP